MQMPRDGGGYHLRPAPTLSLRARKVGTSLLHHTCRYLSDQHTCVLRIHRSFHRQRFFLAVNNPFLIEIEC